MTQAPHTSPITQSELSKMIRRVSSLKHDYVKKSEQLISLDLKTERAYTKLPWQSFMSTYAYYWVSTSDYHTLKGRSIELQDMKSGGKVRLSFDYRIKCVRGEEHLVVELVGKTDDPGQALESAIIREIETCAYHKRENFLRNYNAFEAYLKEHMYGWAESNGMSLDIYLTPQLDEPELLEGFEITVGENKDWELTTRDSRIAVRLSVSLHGKIVSFEGKLGDYLNTKEKLREKIKDIIKNVCQQYIHSVSPEKFYMQFEESVADAESVQYELSKKIKERLHELFNIEVSALIIRQPDTALTQRFSNLAATFGEFDLTNNADSIHFNIRFHVERVHERGWATFQSKKLGDSKSELSTIGENLNRHMRLFLDTHVKFDFQNVKSGDLNQLIDELFHKAAHRIAIDFGLVVRLSSKTRAISEAEALLIEKRRKENEKIRTDQQNDLVTYQEYSNLDGQELSSLQAELDRALKSEDTKQADAIRKKMDEKLYKFKQGTNLTERHQKLEDTATADIRELINAIKLID